MAIGEAIEIALPVKALGHPVSFQIVVTRELNGARVEVERHPRNTPIVIDQPAAYFDAAHWSA